MEPLGWALGQVGSRHPFEKERGLKNPLPAGHARRLRPGAHYAITEGPAMVRSAATAAAGATDGSSA
jgi:hypothetical protein